MTTTRRISLWAGVLFALTFLTSIPAAALYGGFGHVLKDPQYVLGGSDARVQLGALLELVLLFANIGSAVVLFPILKWQSEAGAVGYVTARVIESAFILVGILSLLAVITIGDQASTGTAKMLIAVHDWTFTLGPGFVVGVGNGMLLGWMMYRSGLVPRRLALFGLVGGPLVVVSGAAVVLGLIDAGGSVQSLATVPEIVWEAGLTIYLIVKGFRSTPLIDLAETEREHVRMERAPLTVR
jgi:hypothetical protein